MRECEESVREASFSWGAIPKRAFALHTVAVELLTIELIVERLGVGVVRAAEVANDGLSFFSDV